MMISRLSVSFVLGNVTVGETFGDLFGAASDISSDDEKKPDGMDMDDEDVSQRVRSSECNMSLILKLIP